MLHCSRFLQLTIFSLLLILPSLTEAQELPYLFNKNHVLPKNQYEIDLVDHVKKSLENALHYKSKLNQDFKNDSNINIWPTDTPSDHLLNNLCNLPGASHLHIGVLKGGSFIAALYGNEEVLNQKIALDWFKEVPRGVFDANCSNYLTPNSYTIIESGCFDLDLSLITEPIDLYFYDADHSMLAHQKAFTYYDTVFADVFVAVVDDWRCPWVRRPTFKAFEKLGYAILYEAIIPESDAYGHGQYVAIIKKRNSF